MDFKSILQHLSQLSEATKDTDKGVIHKAGPGGYGRKFDTDPDGEEEEKKPEVKRGRGRPKKVGGDAETAAKYGGAKELQNWIVGNVPKGKLPGKATKTNKLKEYIEKVDEMMTQQPIPVVGKQGQTQSTSTGFLNIDDSSPAGQAMKDAFGKLAQQKKAQIVVPANQPGQAAAGATGQAPAGTQAMSEKWTGDAEVKSTGEFSKKSVDELKSMLAKLKKTGPHPENSKEAKKQRQINFALRAKGGWKKGEGAAKKESMAEADLPSSAGVDTRGAGLGAGRSNKALESKRTVKEGANHRISAARFEGKSHGLKGHNHCGKNYEALDERKAYCEGYKDGLDECYGMGVYEAEMLPATVGGMADSEMDEGNAFTAALAKTRTGDKFSLGGKTFVDRSGYDSKLDELAFESWNTQLSSLLTENTDVTEGMTVSISKGQQGMPDSVTVSAQDGEADQLLGLIKQAGLGLFGDNQSSQYGSPNGAESQSNSHGDINVVSGHDGMMSLMKTMTGASTDSDYEDEDPGHEEVDGSSDEMCGTCHESQCQCEDEEMVDEEESYDQEEDVAETSHDEEQMTEWANDAGEKSKDFDDESFTTDIDFMTKTISGGLNKQKSTGQATAPVIPGQKDRMGYSMNESIRDWKKLAGI